MKLPLVVETNSHICIVKQNTGMLYVSLINQDKSRLSQEFKDFETIVRLFVQGQITATQEINHYKVSLITCKLCSAFYTCDVSGSRNHPFSCKLCHVVNFVSTGYIQNLHCDRSVQYLTYILSLKQPNKVYISEFTCVYDYKTNKNPLKRHGNNMSWNISNAIFKM